MGELSAIVVEQLKGLWDREREGERDMQDKKTEMNNAHSIFSLTNVSEREGALVWAQKRLGNYYKVTQFQR